MGRVDDLLARVPKLFDALEDRVPGLGIDADRRFVEQDKFRIVDDRDRQVEPPLHAAGVLGDDLLPDVRQIGEVEAGDDPFFQVGSPQTVEAAEEAQVVGAADLLVEGDGLRRQAERPPILRVAWVPVEGLVREADHPFVRFEQTDRHVDRRRLAGAVRTQQPEHFAGLHFEGQVVDRAQVAEGLADMVEHEHGVVSFLLRKAALLVAAGSRLA